MSGFPVSGPRISAKFKPDIASCAAKLSCSMVCRFAMAFSFPAKSRFGEVIISETCCWNVLNSVAATVAAFCTVPAKALVPSAASPVTLMYFATSRRNFRPAGTWYTFHVVVAVTLG